MDYIFLHFYFSLFYMFFYASMIIKHEKVKVT